METLDIHSSVRDIEDYLERFEILWMTKDANKKDKQTAYFLTFIGKEAYALLKNLAYPKKPISLSYDELKALLLHHLQPVNFEIAERAKFNELRRKPDQKIREFILQLQTQASKCGFGDQLEVNLRDRIIAGIELPELKQQLLSIKQPTFQSVRSACEHYEDVNAVVKEKNSANADLFFSSRQQSFQRTPRQFNPTFKFRDSYARSNQNSLSKPDENKTRIGKCMSCGKTHSRYTCPHRKSRCFACGRIGHLKSVCRHFKPCHFTDARFKEADRLEEDFNSLSLAVLNNPSEHVYQKIFNTDGKSLNFIVDTGSVESIISQTDLVSFSPSAVVVPTTTIVKGITGHSLPVVGSCTLRLFIDHSHVVSCQFLVINSGPPILGLKAISALKISLSFVVETKDTQVRNLILRCSEATGGMTIDKVHLEVSGDPIFMKRRVLPFGLREPVRKVLKSLCERGILCPVAASKWATAIVTPLKADGMTPRICGDYRLTLNTRLLQRTCTTEEPEDVLQRLAGSVCFSKIDLQDAYLQIPLDDASSELTTINTPFGLFRYKFLPFGLSVSPAIFQDVMNKIVAGIEGVVVYQDDIIVYGPDKATHTDRLLALLGRLANVNVAINPKKCLFSVDHFTCLGYEINGQGFKPDPKRLSPLIKAPSPTNHEQLRSLLGALQYYSRFIPNFSKTANILFDLQNSKAFNWSPEHEKVLRFLLEFLRTDAILQPFSPKLHTSVITDASPTGIGAILEQEGKPVICISRRLSDAEKGYAQTQREALAVYWAIRRLHKYLFGLKFTIVTDHEALKFIYDPKKSIGRSSAAMVQRWNIFLSAYDYTIEHRNGNQIPHVDFLSRYSAAEAPSNSNCLLAQPLPICRSILIQDTRKYFGSVIIALRKGWRPDVRKRFPVFYARREELSTTPDGLLCLNDRIVIPPTLRRTVLQDLHSGHLGVEKMKSLARLTCWWPEIDADIRHMATSCDKCQHKITYQPSNWTPWPLSYEGWQRIHADYCGPFLNKYYALVLIDSYSKWPEVFFTTNATADFTMRALRKTFSREGVPIALVTDNGTHFTSQELENWLKGLGCRHLHSPPRHPQSNGIAENFVRTLKSAITALSPRSFDELDRGVDNFLLQYRNSKHSSTQDTPAKLLHNRTLRSNTKCIESAEVNYYRGNDMRPSTAIVLKNLGRRMLSLLDLDDCTVHSRHVDQVRYKSAGQCSAHSSLSSDNDSSILDTTLNDTENENREVERT